MQTTDITKESCSYYDPCGGDECKECNATRGVHLTVLPNPYALLDRLLPLRSCAAPGGLSPSGGGPLSCGYDSDLNSSAFRGAMEQDSVDPKGVSDASEGEFEIVRRARKETHTRVVKGITKKRRMNARERKEKRSSKPPSGIQLAAGSYDNYKETKKVPNRSDNKFDCLEDDDGEGKCRFSDRLVGKAKALVSFLSEDLGIQGDCRLLPPRIECGCLRSAIRGCFPSSLSCVEELSIKTTQKVEKSCCKFCRPRFDRKLSEWKEALQQPVTVDENHLNRFRDAIRSNIGKGWNSMPGPFIPNGSATLTNKVKEGGNWAIEDFSEFCRATLVFSSGKPRVVTCYSARNTEVLTPLHNSLYQMLGRKGWLLVGDPTTSRVAGLNGDGSFLSFDYVGATDNIKSAYTRAAVEVLIEQAEGLSADEMRCMRVLGELQVIDGNADDVKANLHKLHDSDILRNLERGQPMGSALSFPLLCLINKTVVDMSLTDLLLARVISFNEWTQHRCLINGDDLLVKEPKERSNLKDAIIRNGSAIGLIVNEEKSGVSDEHAEINSTSFSSGGTVKQVKTNAGSLYMSPDTEDVLGFAKESCRSIRSFVRVARANANLLAKQEDKMLWRLPFPYQAAVRKDKKLKKAVGLMPLSRKGTLGNLFPIVPKPADYFLTREEEVRVLNSEVERVRNDAIELQKAKAMMKFCGRKKIDGHWGTHSFRVIEKPVLVPHGRSWRSLTRKRRAQRDDILLCLERAFRDKQKDTLVEVDGLAPSYLEVSDEFHDESLYSSKIDYLTQAIRGYASPTRQVCQSQCVDLGMIEVQTEIRYIRKIAVDTSLVS